MLHLEHIFVWYWNLDTPKSRSEILWKFWNLVLEKDGEDHLDWWVINKALRRIRDKRNIRQTIKRKKTNWIGHILSMNCLLKHVIEGKVEVKWRRGRRCKQLLDDLKETRGCWKLKEEDLDGSVWRIRFGRGYDLSQGRLKKELIVTHAFTRTGRPVREIPYQSEGYLWILFRVKI
jgi:hypothetical protein